MRVLLAFCFIASFTGCSTSWTPSSAPAQFGPNAGIRAAFEPANAATVVFRFRIRDGGYPIGRLVAVGTTLYGTASSGGTGCKTYGGCGTIFSVSSNGAVEILYKFKGGNDGALPLSGLLSLHGKLYGTTFSGGDALCATNYGQGCGTVFVFDPASRQEHVLHAFLAGKDGAGPLSVPVFVKGTLYGTTQSGGACPKNTSGTGCGTIFGIDTTGKSYRMLYAFKDGAAGAQPNASLTNVGGILFGAAFTGGTGACAKHTGCGTIFRFDPGTGRLKTLYSFKGGTDGWNPMAGLVSAGGLLYGMTFSGGMGCASFSYYDGCGTVFSFDPANNTEKVLHAFTQGLPAGRLIFANGKLYGVTETGGTGTCGFPGAGTGCGTVFSIVPNGGSLQTIHNFPGHGVGGKNGAYPQGGLTMAGGRLYGVAQYGGNKGCYTNFNNLFGCGVIFSLSP